MWHTEFTTCKQNRTNCARGFQTKQTLEHGAAAQEAPGMQKCISCSLMNWKWLTLGSWFQGKFIRYLTALFPHIRSCSPSLWGLDLNHSDRFLTFYNLSVPKSHLIITEWCSKETLPHGTAVARLFPSSISLNHFSSLILMTACSFPICHLPPPVLEEKSDTNSRAYSAL